MNKEHRKLVDAWVASNPFKAEAYRAAVIEECARVADGFEEAEFGYNPTAVKIAAAIRALKDKP